MKLVEWVIVTGVFVAALLWLETILPGGWRGIGSVPPALDQVLARQLPSVGRWQDRLRVPPKGAQGVQP